MNDLVKLVLAVCGATVTLAAAMGVVWWLVKPRVVGWVEDQILRPVHETHHQVTVNHHSSAEPTVLDRLEELTTAVAAVSSENQAHAEELGSLHDNLADLTHVFMKHLTAASD